MHLCERCDYRAETDDWDQEPVLPVPATVNNHVCPDKSDQLQVHRCQCGLPLGWMLLRYCEKCAYRFRKCQICSTSTLTAEQKALVEQKAQAEERLAVFVDLFTVLVKTYGYTSAYGLLKAHEHSIGLEEAAHALRHSMSELDERISSANVTKRRDVVRELYGEVFRSTPPRCAECQPPWRGATPALCKADSCGHWTHGVSMAWCLFCAMKIGYCANCGVATR